MSGRSFDSLNDLLHGKPVTIAAIGDKALAALSQIVQCGCMSRRQITHMDVVANTCAIDGRIVITEYIDVIADPEGGLAGDFDEMCRIRRRLPYPPFGVAACHIEIA